ncbi:ectoine hydrolase DoeA [Acuticoccus sediminis]|uniref:Ectoine hydrolase DoeA n=1 Tax=Acuticoccus sediminis TaxID=2184697 RepID=A0A8B2P3N7_9HYPH|nr:ectoine hydrolase DoeA [Acuticoccus sediminis]
MTKDPTTIVPRLHFEPAEFEARIAKTRAAMERAGVDAIVVSDPSNMAWLTGYDGWSFYVHQCVVLGLAFDPFWFGREQDAQGAYRTVFMGADNVIGYADHYVQSEVRHPMEVLAADLATRGLSAGTVGVEMDNYWFSARAFATLQKGLPDATFTDTTGLVNWQRAVKSPQELAYMRTAARIVERMHKRIAEVIEPGMRKCDLVADIYDAALRYDPEIGAGGDYPAIVPLLPSGSDAAAPHLTWDDRPMKSGEATFFEIAGVYNRYHCPLSRTVSLGAPSEALKRTEEAVLEGMEKGLAAARAGNLCEDVANAFFAVLRKYGIEKNNRTGYPIGISYPPDWGERTMSLRPGDKTVLEPNMTFHFMTGIWAGDYGLEITESIVIGEGGPECLANVERALVVK